MNYKFSITGLVEEASSLIDEIAGRRAAQPDDYYRHAACLEGAPSLTVMVQATAAWLVSAAGARRLTVSMEGDALTFSTPEEERSDAVATLLHDFLIHGVVARWFALTGLTGYTPPARDTELLEALREALSGQGGLNRRPVPPI